MAILLNVKNNVLKGGKHYLTSDYKTRNSKDNSLGLGLAFTKSIILNQGGDIKVTSKKGYGTEFMIEL